MVYPKKKTKKDHHKPKKIIAADRPHPHFRHFMVEKYEIKVYLNLLKLTKYERISKIYTNLSPIIGYNQT